MGKVKVAIIDDEPLAIEILQTYLAKIPEASCMATCKNALELFTLLSQTSIDVLLLDINMPEMSGIDFLRTIKNPPKVIFTTAYSDFALESYELNAVDYLLKPFSFERFQMAFQKVFPAASKVSVETFAQTAGLYVRSDGKWINIKLDELWLVEGLKDYLRLWIGTERIIIHSTMKNFEEQLRPYPQFIRVHKSYIVNLQYVKEFSNNSLLINGQHVAVGNTYKDDLVSILQKNRLV